MAVATRLSHGLPSSVWSQFVRAAARFRPSRPVSALKRRQFHPNHLDHRKGQNDVASVARVTEKWRGTGGAAT